MTEFEKAIECMQDNTDSIFTEIDQECASYWEDKDEKNPCVLEYMFDTPVDMMGMMKIYIENEKLRRQVTADSFRQRAKLGEKQTNGYGAQETPDVALPEYVYVF